MRRIAQLETAIADVAEQESMRRQFDDHQEQIQALRKDINTLNADNRDPPKPSSSSFVAL